MSEPRNDDEFLEQVRSALTPMPSVNRQAIADILSAVAVRKTTRWQRLRNAIGFTADQWWYATSPLARGGAIAAIALTVGFVGRGYVLTRTASQNDAASRVAVATPGTAPVSIATSPAAGNAVVQTVDGATDRSSLRVTTQFVLDAREVADASTVSVVGDFNDWDVTTTPMTLDRGAWSASLPLAPGRHVYAFVINGTRWRADPRAPRATDADFGRPGSVLLVQTP